MKYRSRIDIMCQILDVANGSSITRSKIAYKAFLNHGQLRENLTALVENGLLSVDEVTQTFKTTEKGLRLLKLYKEINYVIKEEDQKPLQEMRIYRM
jgi:predicted transcriptional regulator